jgi:hypothetical protein
MDERNTTKDLSLNEVIRELCIALGYGADYSGPIELMFCQGGLRKPEIRDKDAKAKLVPLLKALFCQWFLSSSRKGKGFVILNIQKGKLSGVPEWLDQSDDFAYGYENLGIQMRRDTVWWALKKHPTAPINKLLADPHRYSSRSASSIHLSGGVWEKKYYKHKF